MKRSQIGRAILGTCLGTLVGAVWITAALIIDARVSTESNNALSPEGFVLVGLIQFLTVGAVFLVIGIPAYLLSLGMRLPRKIPGITLGLVLGMLGSLGYGVDWHLHNLLFGVAVFGIGGALAALTFLFVAERGQPAKTGGTRAAGERPLAS